MRKAYDDEAAFDLGYGTAAEYVIANKAQIVNWWKGTADTQSGFEQDGAIIGETWDGPIFQLKNQGRPYNYMAPVEGALTWIDFDRPDRRGGQSRAGLRLHQLGVPAGDRRDRLRRHRLQLGGQGLRAARRRAASRRTSPTPIPSDADRRSCGCRARSGPGSWRSARRWSTRSRRPEAPDAARRRSRAARRQRVSAMADDLHLDGRDQALRRIHRRARGQPDHRGGRVLLLPRPVGLRQDHDPAHDLRLHRAERRRDPARRPVAHGASAPTSGRPR